VVAIAAVEASSRLARNTSSFISSTHYCDVMD
jgi:hypothetical protein